MDMLYNMSTIRGRQATVVSYMYASQLILQPYDVAEDTGRESRMYLRLK